jgi:CTP synthase
MSWEAPGMIVSGTSPDGKLVEVMELREHRWYVAVQCHPEFKSKPTHAHPLFHGFIRASLGRRDEKKVDGGSRCRGDSPVNALAAS